MERRSLDYRANAARTLRENPEVRASVTGAALHFDASRRHGYGGIDADAWRAWAESVKSHSLTHLDRYLTDAAGNLEANGACVHFAATAGDARSTIQEIATRHGVRRVVKGKSMLSEELEVNEHLESHGIEVFETDLGEYILQLLKEPPSHILGPAIHRSLDDIRRLFQARFGTPPDASPDALAREARRVLRSAFLTSEMGITGGNFLVAETGTVAIIENEGNIRLSTSLPRVHVALVGIEKVLPRWTDLAPFLQLTARAATGQTCGTFVSLIQGPRRHPGRAAEIEPDGPDEVHVILVDNGRSRILADPVAWEVLRCVRCGACLNVCPVYRQTGGHAYGWVYSGPLGAVLNPGLLGLGETHPLPFASTLCGACGDACPVRIPIPRLLLEWRNRATAAGLRPRTERAAIRAFTAAATRPSLFRAAGDLFARTPQFARRSLPVLRDWAAGRAPLEPARPSFLQRWQREPATAAATEATADSAMGRVAAGNPAPEARTPTDSGARAQVVASDAGEQKDHAPDEVQERRAFAGGALRRTARDRSGTGPGGVTHPVLQAVRDALEGRARFAHPGLLVAADDVAGSIVREVGSGEDDSAGAVADAFANRFRANGGEAVCFASLDEATAWLSIFAGGFTTAAVSSFVIDALSPLHFGLAPAAPETATLGVSAAIAAAAASGTLLLDSRERRGVQLLPPVHLVWVQRRTVLRTLALALDGVRTDLPAALGLHSGPSKSADIGRVLVTGVHGPGRVIAAIVP